MNGDVLQTLLANGRSDDPPTDEAVLPPLELLSTHRSTLLDAADHAITAARLVLDVLDDAVSSLRVEGSERPEPAATDDHPPPTPHADGAIPLRYDLRDDTETAAPTPVDPVTSHPTDHDEEDQP